MEGSGIIRKSSFGYKIGDRIITISEGASGGFDYPKYLGNHKAKKGDEGIITGVCGDVTEILYSCGEFGYRNEHGKEVYFKIITNTTPTYEIY